MNVLCDSFCKFRNCRRMSARRNVNVQLMLSDSQVFRKPIACNFSVLEPDSLTACQCKTMNSWFEITASTSFSRCSAKRTSWCLRLTFDSFLTVRALIIKSSSLMIDDGKYVATARTSANQWRNSETAASILSNAKSLRCAVVHSKSSSVHDQGAQWCVSMDQIKPVFALDPHTIKCRLVLEHLWH